MSKYPEHERLSAIKDKSQAVGEFLDWLNEQNVILAKHHKHTDACRCTNDEWHNAGPRKELDDFVGCPTCGGSAGSKRNICGYMVASGAFGHDELAPIHRDIRAWLELYFDIDPQKIEEEKRAMLEEMREAV